MIAPTEQLAEIASILNRALRASPALFAEAQEWAGQALFEKRIELKDAEERAAGADMIGDVVAKLTNCDRGECRAITREAILLSRVGVVLHELRRFAAQRLTQEKGGKRGAAA